MSDKQPSPSVLIERRGAVDWVTLNRPERLNAITPDMVEALSSYFGSLEKSQARVVVLRGAGEAFCAGLDIKEYLKDETAMEKLAARGHSLSNIVLKMRSCPQPVVSLLQGAACGGGFVFALASDVRIGGESLRMNDAFIKLGLSGCELGVSYFLPRLVGQALAAEMMLTGRFIDAGRALRAGLVSEVVPDAELERAGVQITEEMLAATPLGLRLTKETLGRADGMTSLAEVIAMEEQVQQRCLEGPDFAEALTAFAQKRPPRFTGGARNLARESG